MYKLTDQQKQLLITLKEKSGKWFHCGCREWRIAQEDETNADITGYFKVHACDKIKVYQKGIKRIFLRN